MEENIYQTPASQVVNEDDQNEFYVVSIRKFTLLFFLTLGIYSVFWFYKNWKEFKLFHDFSIWPVPRAIFSIFFVIQLFSYVKERLQINQSSYSFDAKGLGIAYIVFAVIDKGLSRLSYRNDESIVYDLLSIALLPVVYVILLKAQKAINHAVNDPDGSQNDSFTAANYVWMILGGILWLLVILGIFATVAEPVMY